MDFLQRKKIPLIICLGILLMTFNHCMADLSKTTKKDLKFKDKTDTTSTPVATSDSPLPTDLAQISISAFESSVYPITVQRCALCHASLQRPYHSSPTVKTAHDEILNNAKVDFSNPTSSRLVLKLEEGHNCWGNCSSNADEMLTAVNQWKEALDAASEEEDMPTAEETITLTTEESITVEELLPAGTTSAVVTFQLNDLGVTGQLRFNIENFDLYTYKISNLRITTTNSSVLVKNIKILINGKFNPQHSSYTTIDRTVSSGTTTLSSYAMLMLKDLGNDMDRLQVSFETLEPVTP